MENTESIQILRGISRCSFNCLRYSLSDLGSGFVNFS